MGLVVALVTAALIGAGAVAIPIRELALESDVRPGQAPGERVVTRHGYIAADGTRLTLDGRPFALTGLNIYNAASDGSCWYRMASGRALARSLEAISWAGGGGARAIRTWFFEDMAVKDGRRDWRAFDHLLRTAGERGFLVIPVLANQWGDCERRGGYKDESWYREGYRSGYRDWVREVVWRYRDNPVIAMWSLMNEAEARESLGGRCPESASRTLRAFADDMGRAVKESDPNHLLTLGTIGTGQCGASWTQYQEVYASAYIDVCEYHDYHAPASPMPGDQWNGLLRRLNQCRVLGKPLVVGEAGIEAGDVRRPQRFEAKLAAQFAAGISGFLVWDWRAGGRTDGDPYVVGPGDPVLAVLGRYGGPQPGPTPPTVSPAVPPTTPPTTGGPPMGWNHYNRFGNNVNEAMIRQVADAMVVNGMRDAGYTYVNVDDSWQGGRDADGKLIANGDFPSGMRALADYVHARGLKFGIYTTPTEKTCAGRTGSAGHVQRDVETFAEWGVDYIKLDWCGADYSADGARGIAQEWRDAIEASGRPMVLSVNAGANPDVGRWASQVATMWRTTGDICASWFNRTAAHAPEARNCFTKEHHMGLYDIINGSTVEHAPHVGPGRWADPDMLEVGNPGLTPVEARTEFSLWAMWSAPLIAGNDPRDGGGLDVLLNTEVIAVDQDPLAEMARKTADDRGRQVWTKPLADGGRAVLLLNAGETAADITVDFGGGYQVRDLWSRTDLGEHDTFTARNIAPHAAVMLRLKAR